MRTQILVALALSVTALHATEPVTKPASRSILLAYEKTSFKKNLVEEMSRILKEDSVDVSVVVHSKKGKKLDAEEAGAYDAVFISNSGVMSKVRPWIVEWVENNKEHADRIILHTTQTRDWEVETIVDAVTSASKDDPKNLAPLYVQKIKALWDDPEQPSEGADN
ncbi:MAG: hypothetical protein GF344_07590 [Chitinivibrionales bacterium]|nr:hypothetical protein [Chitinivibrionales bacterium]MBD3356761.1 hypothetical protein [Chitinivibrionales bacterium]